MNIRTTFLYTLLVIACLPGWTIAEESQTANPQVRLETSLGNIDIELYPEFAPVTVENFLGLVDDEFYNGLIFHRVIADFMIQAGGYDADMNYRNEPGTIVNESANGLLNRKGYLAMARLADPDSAGAQFFINVRRSPHLDGKRGAPGYAVFGKVIKGWEVVEEIRLADTGIKAGMPDVPDTPIVINQAVRLPAAKRTK